MIALCQDIKTLSPVTFPTPNAAALGQYGKIPVSLFTGTPNISIPLYEINDGDLSVPIVMRYHAAGIRPEEHPSWVGLNWSLQAGGAITRNTKKFPDEADLQYLPSNFTTTGGLGYLYQGALLSGSDWFTYSNFNEAEGKGRDVEPDEFMFNFGAFSGSFYLDHNGLWKVKCDDNVIVEPLVTSGANSNLERLNDWYAYKVIKSFRLIGPDGTKYIFGGYNAAIEFTRPKYADPKNKPVATTWYLTKIISADGKNSIDFEYIRGNMNIRVSYFQSRQRSDLAGERWLTSFSCSSGNTTWDYDCQLIEPSFLQSITTSNTKVVFYSSDVNDLPISIPSNINIGLFDATKVGGYLDITIKSTDPEAPDYNIAPCNYNSGSKYYTGHFTKRKKLHTIGIYDLTLGGTIYDNCTVEDEPDPDGGITPAKSFTFVYDEVPTKRLQLQRIVVANPALDITKKYSFEYYDDPSITLPAYNTFQTDHWGFYNGKVSQFQFDTQLYFQAREINSNVAYAKEAVLRKITYPTGGYSEFEFEPHDYSQEQRRYNLPNTSQTIDGVNVVDLNVTKYAGGLRIKSIKSSSGSNSPVELSEYFYKTNFPSNGVGGLSSGLLMSVPQYAWLSNLYVEGNGSGSYSYFSSSSALPLSMGDEGHIGYREVIERRSDNSYTRNIFTLPSPFDPTLGQQVPLYQDMHPDSHLGNTFFDNLNSISLERGKPSLVEIYNSNTTTPIKRTQFTYDASSDRFLNFVRTRDYNILSLCSESAILEHGTATRIFTYPFNVVSQSDSWFEGSTEKLKTESSFTYTNYKQIRTSTTKQSDGSLLVTLYLYPYDYTDASGFIKEMKDQHVHQPIETVVYEVKATSTRIVSGKLVTYYAAPLLGNQKEIFELEMKDGQAMALSDFRFSNQSVKGQIPSSTPGLFSMQNSSDQMVSKYVKRFTFDEYETGSGNLVKFTDAGGLVHGIHWGYNNSLPVAHARNATASEIRYTSFEIPNENGNWSYTSASAIKSANARTGRGLYNLTTTTPLTTTLAPGKYYLEFYALAPPTITGGAVTSLSSATETVPDRAGWFLFKREINCSTSVTLTISGTTSIDEVRLYPARAQVETYTYNPLSGITTSNDFNGNITSYQYDSFLRLENIKDYLGNIVKSFEYRYKAQ
jgi:hypothetical protein